MIIKSGTNVLHGSVFEYFRNDKLNANSWARNWAETPRAAMRWNQFGGTIAGPIFKDKLFFFADYQGLRRSMPPSISSTIVMPEERRRGDFSRLLDPAYSSVAGGIQLYTPYDVDANGNRRPFANNRIPTSLFSPVVQRIQVGEPICFYGQEVARSRTKVVSDRVQWCRAQGHLRQLRQNRRVRIRKAALQ